MMEKSKHEHLEYIYAPECSKPASYLIVGNKSKKNPLQQDRKTRLPLARLRVGEALWFNYAEMRDYKWKNARATARRYNLEFDDMFGIIKHATFLEIVRIK